MSRIFEALQQSESDRMGSTMTPVSAVELVQAAELVNAAKRPPASADEPTREVHEFGQIKALMMVGAPENRVVSLTHQGSLGAEKLRLLALRLKTMKETRKLKKVLITSTMPEEGKSLISANLAITLARSKHLKTLLLECDLRRPTLANVLFGQALPGLSEYLQTSVALKEVTYEAAPSGFFVLPAGSPPMNPLELMQSGKFQGLLDELSAHFDWIVIDSPPTMPLADTSLLMKLVDGVLIVVREGVIEKKPLQRTIEMVPPAQLLGIVLNSSSSTDSKKYYQRYAALKVTSPEATPAPQSEEGTADN
jgi:capsular exopolysaccharide synthesis family protein